MKKITKKGLRISLMFLFIGGAATMSKGQTQLISASDGGFENATSTFAANGWSTAQPGITRQWQVGTAGGSIAGGTQSAYVGTTTTYNGSTTSGTFHFYRDLVIPAGSTNVLLNYELKYPTLDAGFDYFYVFTTTTANTPVSGTLPGTGYTQIFENDGTQYSAFTAMPQVDLTSLAGTTVRLVFTFVTDGITPNAKPAVDNVTLSYITPVACSGTPTPGNTVASAGAVCNGINFTLSMQNNFSGLTYQWQSSPTNSGFTNIGGATGATLTTSQTAATYYQCVVTCTSSSTSAASTPIQVAMTSICNYCVPENNFGCADFGDEITNVTFAGINNTTACAGTPGGYNDYTTLAGNVVTGSTYPISISTGVGAGASQEGVGVWIDYNQNGVFEPSEFAYSAYSGADPATYTSNITIPLTALTGTTRMRVRCDFVTLPVDTNACTVWDFGETEDYTLNITSTSATIDMGSSVISAPTVHCYTSTETVSATVKNFSASAINFATNPVTVNCTVTGANPNNTTFAPVVLSTGTLAAGATQVVMFSTTYNMSAVGTYVITSYTTVTGDVSALNDTTRATFTRAANPTVTGGASVSPICAGLSETLTGGGASTYVWSGGVTNGTAFNATTTTTYTVTGTDVNGCTNTSTAAVTVNQLPTVTGTAAVNPVCINNSDTLRGSGATSYVWSGGITNGTAFNATATTTYTVTGTDANTCVNTGTVTVTVNQLPIVIANASLTPICAGSNETLTGSGASTYVWSNSITDGVAFPATATNTYTVTGTDINGCVNTATTTVTVTPLATMPVAILGSDTLCGTNTSIYYVAAVSGATSYTWSLPSGWSGTSTTDSITVSSATTAGTVSVTANNSCGSSGAQSVNVYIGTAPAQPSSILGVTHLCDSSSTAYAVTNDPNALSYTWTLPSGWSGSSATSTITATASTSSGTISVTANNGCGSSTASTLNVVGNTIPVVTVSSFGTVCDNIGSFALTGGSPTGGTYIGTGVNSNSFDPAVSGDGTFMITYTYASGACVRSDSAAIIVDLCTGINSLSSNGDVTIYPNPTNGMFTIHVSNADFNEMVITVADIQGREVYKTTDKNIASDYNKQISMDGMAKGIYYIKLSYGGQVTVKKLIIE